MVAFNEELFGKPVSNGHEHTPAWPKPAPPLGDVEAACAVFGCLSMLAGAGLLVLAASMLGGVWPAVATVGGLLLWGGHRFARGAVKQARRK